MPIKKLEVSMFCKNKTCQKPFFVSRLRQKFCSEVCYEATRKETQKERSRLRRLGDVHMKKDYINVLISTPLGIPGQANPSRGGE